MFKRLLAAAVLPFLAAACAAPASHELRPAGAHDPVAHETGGVVSAADPRAAEAGAVMLRKGGSAADAAIAVMLALTVVEPQSSGIGGGGFYLHSRADGTVETIDGRETAPRAAGPDWFLDEDGTPLNYMEAVLGGRSVGVPGNIALAAQAHERHGKLAWAELFAPAIALAREGYVLTERGREFLVRANNRAAYDPEGAALYFGADGEPVPAGTLVRNPALAATLEMIASQGPQAFHSGTFAAGLAGKIAEATPGGARMAVEDIADYRAPMRDPVCGHYRAYLVCGMGPPSSGATTVFAILKQLERFDLAAMGPESPAFWHVFAESQRLAFADRELYLADADFVSVPVAGLVDPDYLAARGALIAVDGRMESVEPGTPAGADIALADGAEPAENGTSHFVAVDGAGNAVSYTSTIEGPFGSGLFYEGFYLNNELTDFSFVPEKDGRIVANRVEGGKRPRSSMAPSLVFGADGKLRLAVGAAGGSTIPVQVAKTIIGVIDFGLSAQDAVALPVAFSPGDGIAIEQGSRLEALVPALEALGHSVSARSLPIKTNAAESVDGILTGAADPRSEGATARP